MSDGDGVQPAERILVLGTTPIALAVMKVGAAAGYDVVPFDVAALEGAAAAVLASHGGPDEDPALRAALASAVPYIGVIAGRARAEVVLAALAADGLDTARIRIPAGLDIGPRSPEEVALAILAQAVSLRPRVPGQARLARGARRPN